MRFCGIVNVGNANEMIIHIEEKGIGERLDRFLASEGLSDNAGNALSRGMISRAIKQGTIRVNGRHVKARTLLCCDDCIDIDPEFFDVATQLVPLHDDIVDVIYENSAFIIVNKPAGVLVHPVSFSDSMSTLAQWAIGRYPEIISVGEDSLRPGIVHRLDRDTSGVMVIARTQEAFLALKRAFHERRVQKKYYAIVHGVLQQERGVIDFPIARSVRGDRYLALRTSRDPYKGSMRSAKTSYHVLAKGDAMSIVSLSPHTGRTHQIRVHLHAKGTPIVGDQLYAHRGCVPVDIARHALHACALQFSYGGHMYAFSVPLPHDMRVLWNSIVM